MGSLDSAPSPVANSAAQAGALVRRSVILQKRLPRTTACLLLSPLFFCALVFGLQLLLDSLWLSQPENRCGCQCTRCCYHPEDAWVNHTAPSTEPPCFSGEEALERCNPVNLPGLGDCETFDETKCGTEFSMPDQMQWCEIPHPDEQTPFAPVPQPELRAPAHRGDRNATAVLFTGDDPATAQALTDKLFPESPVLRLFGAISTPASIRDLLPAENASADARAGQLWTQMLSSAQGNLSVVEAVGEDALIRAADTLKTVPEEVAAALSGLLQGSLGNDGVMASPAGMAPVMEWTGSNSAILGTTADPPDTYFSDSAAFQEKLLLANAGRSPCSGPVPPPFNATPFQYECVPVDMVQMRDAKAINDALFCGWASGPDWMDCPNEARNVSEYAAAYDFKDTSAQAGLRVSVWYNDTSFINPPIGYSLNHRMRQSMNMVADAFLKHAMGSDRYASSIVSVKEMPKLQSRLSLDFASQLGATFYMIVMQLIFPVILQQLVYEKHHKLRVMMRMHGLSDAVYWAVSYLWYFALSAVFFTLLIIFGAAFGLKFFTLTTPGVLLVTFFLFGNVQIAFAFLLSALIQNPKSASGIGYSIVFGATFAGSFLMQNLVQQDSPAVLYLQIVPVFGLFRAMYEISEYAFRASYQGAQAMTFADFSDKGNGMAAVLVIFAIEFPIFMLLAWYREQISGQVGTRKHPLFFLPSVRPRRGAVAPEDPPEVDAQQVRVGVEGEDVAAERRRVTSMPSYEGHSIVLKDLNKVYPRQGGKPPKTACRALTMAVERGECFGLLGPNGAGKSTSINMMVGFLTPTSGKTLIEGLDITKDMDRIYPMMGVCPQHDLLWESMTGREHLLFYGRLKNLKGRVLHRAAEEALKSVNLFSNGVADKQVAKYSGGMKRRLSVAISLIGDPLVVYLDEPSTGLDPASRRNLWEVIKQGKRGRAIVLTTHSMEEAEVLCDRLGIFVDGSLQVIGNPKELSRRYGGYLTFTITTSAERVAAAKDAVMGMCPSARSTYCLAGTQKFEMPTGDITIAAVFNHMESIKAQIEVLDWAVANASLEDVFIDIAKKGQVDAANGG
eukprot:jgi/Tetstr1/424890/TSEL_015385.t1